MNGAEHCPMNGEGHCPMNGGAGGVLDTFP